MSRNEEFLGSLGLNPKGRYMFHGTSPENADAIQKTGFKVDMPERNGTTAGSGVYLAKTPEEAASFGPEVLAVKMGKTKVSKDAWMNAASRWHDPRPFEKVLAERVDWDDAHGYWDPDEPHAVVTDPQHLKVAGRRNLSAQFDPKDM